MPRYVYFCKKCEDHFQVWHGMKEKQKTCQLCEEVDCLLKVPQMPIVKSSEPKKSDKTGALTKEYIEKNKELLKEMKKEARGNTHDI